MSLMQVSRRVDYALRAAINLAQQEPGRGRLGRPRSRSRPSDPEEVPREDHPGSDPRRARDLATRVAHGGYLLTRSPAEISFQDVMESVEGPIALNICVGDRTSARQRDAAACTTSSAEGQRRLIDLFATTKLADLASRTGLPPTRITPTAALA